MKPFFFLIFILYALNSCGPKNIEFDIISFSAKTPKYYPDSIGHQSWMKKNEYVSHKDIKVELGQSRYGGPIIDLPKGMEYPKGLYYAGQIDLAEFSIYDKSNLLPKKGQLIFFTNHYMTQGKVIYSDVPNSSLVRHIVQQDINFWDGILIEKIKADKENWQDRFTGLLSEWNYVAGTNQSKIFGIFTHCQLHQEENEAYTFSDRVVLFQAGENGFNNEGVFSILIKKEDLKNRNFDNCEFFWGQT